MAFWIVGLIALVVLGTLLLRALREQSIRRERIEHDLHDVHTPTLEYSVPTGQDPAPVLAALEQAGYTAGIDPHGVHQVVLVRCPDGPDAARAKVRSVIESAHTGVPTRTEVRFSDE